jgi:hypothetical protein
VNDGDGDCVVVVIPEAGLRMKRGNPQDVSNLAVTCARLGVAPPEVMDAVANRAMDTLAAFKAEEYAGADNTHSISSAEPNYNATHFTPYLTPPLKILKYEFVILVYILRCPVFFHLPTCFIYIPHLYM